VPVVTIWGFELDIIYMEVKMSNFNMMVQKKSVVWLVVVVILFVMAAVVYAVLPAISLNSPTSFPVDI